MKLKNDKKMVQVKASLFRGLFFSAISGLLLSGCSGKQTIAPEEQETLLKQERSYTIEELEYKYNHIPKAEHIGKDISESKMDFDLEASKTFSEIKGFKKDLDAKALAFNTRGLNRTGKNKLPEEPSASKNDEPDEHTIKSVNASTNMTKFY